MRKARYLPLSTTRADQWAHTEKRVADKEYEVTEAADSSTDEWRSDMRAFLIAAIAGALFSSSANAQERKPAIEPVCSAQMVAQATPTMPKADYLEVIEWAYGTGSIDQAYAAELRALIEEAYSTEDLAQFVRAHCGQRAKLRGHEI